MNAKLNCWEVKRCGREQGGAATREHGVCAAARATEVDGLNHGKAGGRACWAIAGTLCGGSVQGTFAEKLGSCMKCEFYRAVVKEEGRAIASARAIHDKLSGLP